MTKPPSMLGWLLGNTVMVVGTFLYLLFVGYRWLDGQFSAAWLLAVFIFFLFTCHYQQQISTWNEFREMQRRTYGDLPRSTFFLQLMEGNFGGLLSAALLGLLVWYVIYPLSVSPDAATEFLSPDSVRHILTVGFLLFMLFHGLMPIVKFASSAVGRVIFLPLFVLFVGVGIAHFANDFKGWKSGGAGALMLVPDGSVTSGFFESIWQGLDWIAFAAKNWAGGPVYVNWVFAGLAGVVGIWLAWRLVSLVWAWITKRRQAHARARPVEVLISAGAAPSASQAMASIPKFAKEMLARERKRAS